VPNLVPVQESFSAGELSPRLYARSSSKGYKEGAKILENLMALPQGPARRRPGFLFTFEVQDTSPQARIIPFPITGDDYYIFLFTDLKLYVLNKTGQPVAPELALNSAFHQGATNWTPVTPGASTVVFSLVTCTLTSASINLAAIQQNVAGFTVGLQYRLRVIQLFPFDSLRLRVGTTAGGFEVAQVTSSLGVISLVFVATAITHWIEVTSITSAVTAVLDSVSVQLVVAGTPIVSPYASDVLGLLQFEQSPDGIKMYVTSGRHPVKVITHDGSGGFTFSDVVFVSPPPEWTGVNQPRSLTFFQGRLWFGGTASTPSKFWGSKSGLFEDFTLGTALDDEAIAHTIAKKSDIRWMAGAKNLLIGTENTEYAVNAPGGSQEVITPTTVSDVEPQSTYGSLPAQPTLLGNVVLFFSADGRKLYTMGFRFEEGGWTSSDLAFMADHVTINRVVRQAFTTNPESILWAIDGQGGLIACSYERTAQAIGWHRHPSQLNLNSLASVKFFGTDALWASWRIVRNNVIYTQVGVMTSSLSSLYLDAAKVVSMPSPTTLIPGFAHLAGFTVGVIVDKAVHPPVVVSPTGELTLQIPATEVAAGLLNTAKLVSLGFEPGIAGQSSEALWKRFNKAYVNVLSSGIPIINGIRPADRHPATPMDTPEPFTNGRLFSVGLGYDLLAQITVEEPLPIPLTVGGIFGELQADKT
jgi:hypothetical protein